MDLVYLTRWGIVYFSIVKNYTYMPRNFFGVFL